MNYGFVKVAAAVPHVKVADCKFNVERIESQIAILPDILAVTYSDSRFCWKKQRWG